MATPVEIKESFFNRVHSEALAAKLERREQLINNNRTRSVKSLERIEAEALEEANAALKSALVNAVTTGEKLPEHPITSPIEVSDSCSFYSNAGGMILSDTAGTPVSVAAADANDRGDSNWVSTEFNGAFCVMTVEEAFDRGLKESANVAVYTSVSRAARQITANIAGHAKQAIIDGDNLGKKL